MRFELAAILRFRWCARVAAALLFWFLPSLSAHAQLLDGFEGGDPRWALVDSDCEARITSQSIDLDAPRGGLASESISIVCQQGTQAILGFPIEPTTIIDELEASVWFRSNKRGAQIGMRVTFPKTRHPTTGRPHSIWIWQDSYRDETRWQALRVGSLTEPLRKRVRVLRSEFGAQLNWSDAYVDMIGLNVYAGKGGQKIHVDDLQVTGILAYRIPEMKLAGHSVLLEGGIEEVNSVPGKEEDSSYRSTIIETDPSVWRDPRSPRWIQYQGEPMAWLASLGFTGVVFSASPTLAQLEEARAAQLRVVCPPPETPPSIHQAIDYQAVEAWILGSSLDREQLDEVRREVQRLRDFPKEFQRPVLVEPVEMFWNFSRSCQGLLLPCPPPGSIDRADVVTQFLQQAREQCRGELPTWAAISTQPLLEWVNQIELAQVATGQSEMQAAAGDPLQIRFQVYRSLAAGLRGVYFRSRTALDRASEVDQARSSVLQWINAELDLLSPWLVAGQVQQRVSSNDGSMEGVVWETARSQLLVLQPSAPETHLCYAPISAKKVNVSIRPQSPAAQVFRVTDFRMESVATTRSPGGIQLQIDRPRAIEMIVLTTDPQVARYLHERIQSLGPALALANANIAQQRVQLAHNIVAARWQAAPSDTFREDLIATQRASREVETALNQVNGSLGQSLIGMHNAIELSQATLNRAYTAARQDLLSPQSSPMVLSVSSLPMHWHLGRSIGNAPWQMIGIAGGGMDDLDAMLKSGWTQGRRLEDQAEMLVEVIPNADPDSGGALRLAAKAKTSQPLSGGYAGATLIIASPPMDVHEGEVLRIEGRVKVQTAFQQPMAGLLLYDSHTGPLLGQLISDSKGQWQPFRLYRVARQTAGVQVLFEVRGEGDVLVDNVTVSRVTPQGATSRFPVQPISTPDSASGVAAPSVDPQ